MKKIILSVFILTFGMFPQTHAMLTARFTKCITFLGLTSTWLSRNYISDYKDQLEHKIAQNLDILPKFLLQKLSARVQQPEYFEKYLRSSDEENFFDLYKLPPITLQLLLRDKKTADKIVESYVDGPFLLLNLGSYWDKKKRWKKRRLNRRETLILDNDYAKKEFINWYKQEPWYLRKLTTPKINVLANNFRTKNMLIESCIYYYKRRDGNNNKDCDGVFCENSTYFYSKLNDPTRQESIERLLFKNPVVSKALHSYYKKYNSKVYELITAILKGPKTQTKAHVSKLSLLLLFSDDKTRNLSEPVANALMKATQMEQSLYNDTSHNDTSQKKYIFYHGQKWNIYWQELLYTKLWEHKKGDRSSFAL